MTESVAVPLWLLVVLVALALFAALDWLLLPGVRWYFRRKVSRVMDEISTRLQIQLPEFKLTRRRALIDRLIHDPRVQAAAEQHVQASGDAARGRRSAGSTVYAREIVPSFNAYVYFRVGYWLAKTFAQMVYRVRLGYTDTAALAAVDPNSSIVFVMNHRSNMDYVLVAFLAAERVALCYAVGEWARIWPLQQLIRSMGAYFVRRNSGDPLYRMVLQRYVQMATEGGVPQAMYPEGGLTIDGRLRPPKLGLLDYMLKAFDPHGERDLVFVPVGINYDRVLEDRSLLASSIPPRRGAACATRSATTAAFVGRQLRSPARQALAPASATPASTSARRCRCARYVAEHGVDFRALDDAARRAGGGAGRRAADGADRRASSRSCRCRWSPPSSARPGAAASELELKSEVHELIRPRRGRRRARLRAARRPRLRGGRGTAHADAARPVLEPEDGPVRRQPRRAGAPRLLRPLDRPSGRVAMPLGPKQKGPRAPFDVHEVS